MRSARHGKLLRADPNGHRQREAAGASFAPLNSSPSLPACRAGIFSTGKHNPFSEFTVIYVPYCSSDAVSGP